MEFTKKEYPTIMSGRVVRFEIDHKRFDGEINASRDGVSIQGSWPIFKDVDAVIDALKEAKAEYESMKKTEWWDE